MEQLSLKEQWKARVNALNEVRRKQWEQAVGTPRAERLQMALELSTSLRDLGLANPNRRKPAPGDYSWREKIIKKLRAGSRG
jgi:hypothetical protein